MMIRSCSELIELELISLTVCSLGFVTIRRNPCPMLGSMLGLDEVPGAACGTTSSLSASGRERLVRSLPSRDPKLPLRLQSLGARWGLNGYRVFFLARLPAITPLGAPLAHAWLLLGYRVLKGQLLEST